MPLSLWREYLNDTLNLLYVVYSVDRVTDVYHPRVIYKYSLFFVLNIHRDYASDTREIIHIVYEVFFFTFVEFLESQVDPLSFPLFKSKLSLLKFYDTLMFRRSLS